MLKLFPTNNTLLYIAHRITNELCLLIKGDQENPYLETFQQFIVTLDDSKTKAKLS